MDGEENYQACGNQNAQELPDDPSVNLVQPTVRPSARARAPHTDLQPCWTMKKEQVQESKYKEKNLKFIWEQKSRSRSRKCGNKSKWKNITKTRQKRKNEIRNDFIQNEKIVIILNLLDYINDSSFLTVD